MNSEREDSGTGSGESRRNEASAITTWTESSSAEIQATEIGERLKTLRRSRGYTLSQLADKARLSVSAISQTERGLVSPTVRTIYSICEALGVSPAWIIDPRSAKEHDPDGGYIVRANARAQILNTKSVVKELASPANEEHYRAFILTVEPGGTSGEEQYTHVGEEIGFMLSGSLVIVIDSKEYRVSKGDSFAFPSDLPHRFFNETAASASVFWVNSRK